jgi:uncharacterized heparinase superfamily protein
MRPVPGSVQGEGIAMKLRSLELGDTRVAECPDDGRVVLFRGRCPFCRGEAMSTPGGLSARARRLPWLRKLVAVGAAARVIRRLRKIDAWQPALPLAP